MTDPTTPNKFLNQPTRGSDVGTWDTPLNANASILDNSLGGVVTVALTNSNITLSANQYQCVFINFTGAISANVAVTLPAVGSFYTIQNLTSNTSAFYITMLTTAAGGQVIGIPPGVPTEIMTDGVNVKFSNFGEVGTYWDYAGSSVPAWLSVCTVPPRLNCDGTSFSSATYPILATILGGTTLPDARGRYRATLNQGTGRITSSAGVDGNTLLAAGGSMLTLSASMIPYLSSANGVTDIGHVHQEQYQSGTGNQGMSGGSGTTNTFPATTSTVLAYTGITVGTTSPAPATLPPTYAAGLTFIRAA